VNVFRPRQKQNLCKWTVGVKNAGPKNASQEKTTGVDNGGPFKSIRTSRGLSLCNLQAAADARVEIQRTHVISKCLRWFCEDRTLTVLHTASGTGSVGQWRRNELFKSGGGTSPEIFFTVPPTFLKCPLSGGAQFTVRECTPSLFSA